MTPANDNHEPAAADLGGDGAGASVPTDSKSQETGDGNYGSAADHMTRGSPAGVERDADRHFHPIKAIGVHIPHAGSIGP